MLLRPCAAAVQGYRQCCDLYMIKAEFFDHRIDECKAMRCGDWQTRSQPTRTRVYAAVDACVCLRL